jgi:Flp pilus assembly protein TadD
VTAENGKSIELAAYYVDAARPREALEELRYADPEDVRTYALRGHALMQLGRIDDAERELRRGLGLDPQHVITLMLLAQAQTPRDAFAAEVTLRKALELEPQNPMLLSTYVLILMEQGRFEWAERMLDRAMKIAPEEVQATRTLFLLRASSSAEALEAAQKMLRDAPDDATAHYLQGLALLRRGRAVTGVRHLREAAALRPADPLFPASARTFGAWYLWPVHLTGGAMHYVLATVFGVAGVIAAFLSRNWQVFWPCYGAWLAFVIYKWVAYGAAMALLKRRVADASR